MQEQLIQLNTVIHFLCEDGTEADMDIGTYEKFLNEDMGQDNFVTMGRIYQTVIDKERRFEYNGEDVEAIPISRMKLLKELRMLVKKSGADIVMIELGGTAGEYQNVFYYEASRMMTLKNRMTYYMFMLVMFQPRTFGRTKN